MVLYKPFQNTYSIIDILQDEDIKTYRKSLRNWYKTLKASSQCSVCESKKKLQYHHIDPSTKTDTISNMVHKSLPMEDIMMEMDKCVLLCCKCHKREHRKKRS